MKRLIFHITLIFALMLFIKGIGLLLVPNSFKENIVTAKWDALSRAREVNTIFTGTSRTAWGIVPAIVDGQSPGMKSFNLAAPAWTVPYSTDWLQKKMKVEGDIKLILIELSVPVLEYNHLYRGLQFYTTDGITADIPLLRYFKASFADNYPNYFGLKPELLAFTKSLPAADNLKLINHYAFDSLGFTRKKGHHAMREVMFQNLNRYTMQAYSQIIDRPSTSPVYEQLIEDYAKLGVTAVFFLPPMIDDDDHAYVMGIYNAISPRNRLKVDSAGHFALLKKRTHRFNAGHFNVQGATEYSALMGQAISRHVDFYEIEF